MGSIENILRAVFGLVGAVVALVLGVEVLTNLGAASGCMALILKGVGAAVGAIVALWVVSYFWDKHDQRKIWARELWVADRAYRQEPTPANRQRLENAALELACLTGIKANSDPLSVSLRGQTAATVILPPLPPPVPQNP